MDYFTADPHYGHAGIIRHCNRPFANAQVMDKFLIQSYNEVVTDDDDCYILGDFSMSTNPEYIAGILSKLNGRKHLILGNHDKLKPFQYVDLGFLTVHTALVRESPIFGRFILIHDPVSCCIDREALWLCGHVHDLFFSVKNTANVGVDIWQFKPVTLQQVVERRSIL